jgi:hypothetical protein
MPARRLMFCAALKWASLGGLGQYFRDGSKNTARTRTTPSYLLRSSFVRSPAPYHFH